MFHVQSAFHSLLVAVASLLYIIVYQRKANYLKRVTIQNNHPSGTLRLPCTEPVVSSVASP